MNNLKTHFDNFFKIYLLFSILILTGCPDQERVINTTKPQFEISLAEISSGPYYSDSCLDCTDISEIKFQVSLSENGEPLANKTIDFTTSAIEGIFPYNHVTYGDNKTSNNGTLLFTFDDKGQDGSIELTVSISESDTTVSASTVIEIEPYYTLVDQLETWLTESSVVAGDTTSAITFYAQVKDSNNASLPNIPIQFMNLSATGTLYSGDPTLNPDDPIYTNSLGKSSLNFKVESTNFTDSTVPLTAEIANLSDLVAMTDTAHVSILSDNSDRVDRLEVWVIAEEEIIDNINVTVIDTIFARALTQQGQVVSNVAVQFIKETDGFGYISESSVLTDAAGLARTIYYPYIGNNPDNLDVQNILFTVSIGGQGLNQQFAIGLDMSGNSNIEYDVNEFSFYPNHDFTTHILGNESEYSVIVKDASGVGVSNVPVRFSITSPTTSTSNGVLSTAIVYTCCADPTISDGADDSTEEGSTGGGDFENNDSNNSTETQQAGTAKIKYYNINGGTDSLKAYVVDPLDASIELQSDIIEIRTNTVTTLNAWAKLSNIYVNSLDSLFCDSLFVKALDSNGNTLEDIQIYYALTSSEAGGYIDVFEDNTTNASHSSTALFCPDPGQYGAVSILVSTNIAGVSSNINIQYYNDLPECQNCTAELTLIADQYILPYTDVNNETIPTSLITATMKDSLGYDPDLNTLIYFEAIQEDDNGDWVDVGSITDFGYFTDHDNNLTTELKAFTTFDMFDASGIVTLIGSSEGLSDTIHISIVSTDPSFIEIIPPYPNEIMVQGGGGIESSNLEVAIKDGDGNPVTQPHWVRYTIIGAPEGTHLNGDPLLVTGSPFDVLSSNGISTVPVNAGSRPGSVQIKVELYASDVNGDIDISSIIATSQGTPITIATGSPAQGVINYSYVDITTIGGGLYQIPVSVDLWDVHSNPVADSTNVYFSIRGVAAPYNPAETYHNGDKIFWAANSSIHGEVLTDSLVYECKAPININAPLSFVCQNDFITNNEPNTPGSGFLWEALNHPANIEGVAKTANENFDGESFPGKAWTYLYFSSSTIFDETLLFAQTYSAGGIPLIIDSRANHDGGSLDLPLTADGVVSVGANPTGHDFTTGGSPINVGVSASINDYYQYPIDNGLLFLNAPFSTILNACNAVDDNGNGITGWCCDDVNGDGDCQDLTDVSQNHFTCSDCGDNNFTWEFDDSGPDGILGNNDCPAPGFCEADGIQDDNPSIGISNRDGSISWTIQYALGINICDCTDGNEVCEDRESNVSVSLLNPLQTSSDPVQVILSESDPTAPGGSCP